jgi:hypothetical protein
MPQFLKDMIVFLRSDYLTFFWWLCSAGYIVAYFLAYLIARVGARSEHTILYQCRKAWGIAFLMHALASSGVMVNWYLQNGMFASFWKFFPFYLTLLIVDICLAFGLLASRQRYVNYHE